MQTALRKCFMIAALSLPIVSIPALKASAEDLGFILNNQSSHTLVKFYVEASNVDNWGENILTAPIPDHTDNVTVTIADGKRTCKYDIRGEFDNGAVVERKGLDLCELGSYTYSD